MNVGEAFTYVFEDERWVTKLLLGSLIMLIPIFGIFAVLGYVIAVIRNVLAGEMRPLPEWDNLGQYFVDGLMVTVANLVYALPIIVLACVIALPSLLPILAGENEDLMAILGGLSAVVMAVIGCLIFLYSLLLWVLSPVIYLRYAVYDTVGACLQFGDVFRSTIDNIGSVLLAQLMMWVGGLVVGLVGGLISAVVSVLSLIPICGWILGIVIGLLGIPLAFWLMAFQGYLYGQLGLTMGMAALPAEKTW